LKETKCRLGSTSSKKEVLSRVYSGKGLSECQRFLRARDFNYRSPYNEGKSRISLMKTGNVYRCGVLAGEKRRGGKKRELRTGE